MGRYTNTDFDAVTERLGEDQYTLGFSKYVVGHKLKIQSDFTYSQLGGEKDFIEFRIGFDVHL